MRRRRKPEPKKSLPSTAICAIMGPPTIEAMTANLCEHSGGYFGGCTLVVTSALDLRIMCPSDALKAKSIETSNEPSIKELRKRAFAITETRQESGLSTDGRAMLPSALVKGLVKLLRALLPGPLFVCGIPATLKHLAALESAASQQLSFAFSLEDTHWDRTEAEVWGATESERHREALLAELGSRRVGATKQPLMITSKTDGGPGARSGVSVSAKTRGDSPFAIKALVQKADEEIMRRRAMEQSHYAQVSQSAAVLDVAAKDAYRNCAHRRHPAACAAMLHQLLRVLLLRRQSAGRYPTLSIAARGSPLHIYSPPHSPLLPSSRGTQTSRV